MDITYIYLLHDCIKNIKDCTHLISRCHTLPATLIIEIKNCIEHSRECFVTYNYTLMSCERLVPALRSTKPHLHDFKKDHARPTDENSCVNIHGKFCAPPSELSFFFCWVTNVTHICKFGAWHGTQTMASREKNTKYCTYPETLETMTPYI